MVFASILLSAPIVVASFYEQVSGNITMFAPILLALPLLILLNQKIFYLSLNTVFKKLRRQTIDKEFILNTKQLSFYTLCFLGPRLVNGVGFLFVVASITQIPPDAFLVLLAAYILAHAVDCWQHMLARCQRCRYWWSGQCLARLAVVSYHQSGS